MHLWTNNLQMCWSTLRVISPEYISEAKIFGHVYISGAKLSGYAEHSQSDSLEYISREKVSGHVSLKQKSPDVQEHSWSDFISDAKIFGHVWIS
jgi:hypothetical protein